MGRNGKSGYEIVRLRKKKKGGQEIIRLWGRNGRVDKKIKTRKEGEGG